MKYVDDEKIIIKIVRVPLTEFSGSAARVSGPPPPLENYKNIGFLSNTGPDPLKNHKATKQAFNVGPLIAR